MNSNSLGLFNLVGLIVLGTTILLATSLQYSSRRNSVEDVLRRVMNIAGWLLIIAGFVGGIVALSHFFSVVLLVISFFIFIGTWVRFRKLRQDQLMWTLAVAAEKGIPLPQAAWAFAAEYRGRARHQSQRLAELLSAGNSLAQAVDVNLRGIGLHYLWLLFFPVGLLPFFYVVMTRNYASNVTTATLVAIRMGEPLGLLGNVLKQAASNGREGDRKLQTIFERLSYLLALSCIATTVVSFILLKIIPVFQKMFREFNLKLPYFTERMVDVLDSSSQYYVLFMPLIQMLVLCGLLSVLSLWPRDLPGFGRFAFAFDRPLILRALGWSVRAGRPLLGGLELLAGRYPRSFARRRIQRASAMVQSGRDWCESLRAVGVVKPADVAVLHAAVRAGNLDWAFEELAESHLRRLTYRLNIFMTLLFPILVIVAGVLVGAIVIGLFLPLVELISQLS